MFYYVDPHLYKTKYATTSNTRAGLPGRTSVGTILFSLIMKALHAGTRASLKPVHFMTPLFFRFQTGVHRFQAGLQ